MIKVLAKDEQAAGVNDYSNLETSESIISDSGTDLVFLLSAKDIVTYFPNEQDNGRIATTTGNSKTAYWLRTGDEPGYPYPLLVTFTGSIIPGDSTQDNYAPYSDSPNTRAYICLRPAIWLKF